jgi:hypothetical protein
LLPCVAFYAAHGTGCQCAHTKRHSLQFCGVPHAPGNKNAPPSVVEASCASLSRRLTRVRYWVGTLFRPTRFPKPHSFSEKESRPFRLNLGDQRVKPRDDSARQTKEGAVSPTIQSGWCCGARRVQP